MTNQDLIEGIVAEWIQQLAFEPYAHFSETDLHLDLAMQLKKGLKDKPVNTNISRGKRRGESSSSFYRMSRVHLEYRAGKGQRSDISIFSSASIKKIDLPDFMDDKNEPIKADYVFELGTEKFGVQKLPAHTKRDINKASSAKICGYVFLIFRNVTSQNKIKKQKVIDKLALQLKNICKNKNRKGIKFLAVLLSPCVARNKLKFFDGKKFQDCVNINNLAKIRQAVCQFLQ